MASFIEKMIYQLIKAPFPNETKVGQMRPQAEQDFSRFEPVSEALFRVEDVFTITGKGTVVTGNVEKGTFVIGMQLKLSSPSKGRSWEDELVAIEKFRSLPQEAKEGENVSFLLKNTQKSDVTRGDEIGNA